MQTNGFSVEDALEIFERRKWWVAVGSAAGMLLGFVSYLALPPEYESSTTILVEPQRVPENFIQSTVTAEISQRLSSLHERVTSHANLNELIDRVGQDVIDPTRKLTRESIMGELRKGLDVEIGAASGGRAANFFQLSYSSRDPKMAARLAREFASVFISENLKDRTEAAHSTSEFLDKELERLRAQLTEQEERIRGFRFERMGSLPSQLDANLRALDRLNLELASNLESQENLAQRVALMKRQLEGTGGDAGGVRPAASAMLLVVRQELAQARRIYTEEHPNVRHLREQVAELETASRNGDLEELTALDPAMASLSADIEDANLRGVRYRREEDHIRARIAEFQERVEETPQREQELTLLTRDYNNLSLTYRDLLGKKFEAALARNLEQAQKGERFKVLRPAQVPLLPSWPDIRVLLPLGLLLGLGATLGAIGLSEFRHPAFRSVERLSRTTELPVFASIPRIDNDEIYESAPTGEVDPKLVAYTAPESAPAEQYRGFLPTFLESEDTRVVLVTSAARGDGKTLTCMNLAVTIAADLNYRVLVIDGDLRRPRTHRVLRMDRKRGLSSLLKGEHRLEECLQNSKLSNVTLLPSGPTVRNPLTLLTSRGFFDLLKEARKHYDVVFIDSPPLLPVVDTRIIRKMADMILFVVRADGTPRDAVVRSLREMKGVGGLIFNQVSPGSFRRYYYYDAYSRYAYGEDQPHEDAEAAEADRA